MDTDSRMLSLSLKVRSNIPKTFRCSVNNGRKNFLFMYLVTTKSQRLKNKGSPYSLGSKVSWIWCLSSWIDITDHLSLSRHPLVSFFLLLSSQRVLETKIEEETVDYTKSYYWTLKYQHNPCTGKERERERRTVERTLRFLDEVSICPSPDPTPYLPCLVCSFGFRPTTPCICTTQNKTYHKN